MAHASLKLIPGVDTTKTPALNEAAISSCESIRFLPDAGGMAYAQKIGGWSAYYSSPMPSTVRALKAWEDLATNNYLAVGCEDGLYAIRNGSDFLYISPLYQQDSSVTLNIVASIGLVEMVVNDVGSGTNTDSFVYFYTPIAIGGTKLYGAYAIGGVASADQYTISAETPALYNSSQTATISNASPALVTLAVAPASGTAIKFTTTGTLPSPLVAGTTYFVQYVSPTTFHVALTPTGTSINTTTAGSGTHTVNANGQTAYFTTLINDNIVNVMFPNHGLLVGSEVFVGVPTTVGGITLSGIYSIYQYLDENNFTIIATNIASSTASAFENNDLGSLIYYYAIQPPFTSVAYGQGYYGSNNYGGVGTPGSDVPGLQVTATDWFLDNWGNTIIANPVNGPIFAWNPTGAIQNAQYIDAAPLANNGVFTAMPQRQLVAWGSTFTGIQDPLLLRWCDVENYNVWDADTTNQAGSYRIPTGSRIVSCMQAIQQGLIWTDVDLWSMQYIGYPLVYGFNKIGSNCGLIAPKAAGQLGTSIYWMSQKQFYTLGGQGVQPLVCPVWDVIYQNLDKNHIDKIRCGPSSSFNEIFWFYPSIKGGSGEIDSYVKVNTTLQQWDYGSIARTAWIDQSQLGQPIGAGLDKILYEHEVSNSANGAPLPASFTTGYFSMSDGDQLVFVDQIWPDMKWGQYSQPQNATVNITINTANYPTDTPISYGPYPVSNGTSYLSVRVRGRLFSFTISSTGAETFWRLGNIRYRIAPDGKF